MEAFSECSSFLSHSLSSPFQSLSISSSSLPCPYFLIPFCWRVCILDSQRFLSQRTGSVQVLEHSQFRNWPSWQLYNSCLFCGDCPSYTHIPWKRLTIFMFTGISAVLLISVTKACSDRSRENLGEACLTAAVERSLACNIMQPTSSGKESRKSKWKVHKMERKGKDTSIKLYCIAKRIGLLFRVFL